MKIIGWKDYRVNRKPCVHYNDIFKTCNLNVVVVKSDDCENCDKYIEKSDKK